MDEKSSCSICGTENDTSSHFCNNCGNPLNAGTPEARKVYRGHRAFYVVALVIGLLIAASFVFGKTSAPEVPQGYVEYSVQLYGTKLTLTNENNYPVENLIVSINPKTGQKGHLREVESLEAGDTIALHTEEFTNDSGGRFNSLGIEIIRVKVTADTPKGRLDWETADIPQR